MNFKKIQRVIVFNLLIMSVIVGVSSTYAFWADSILSSFKQDSLTILIGSWQRELPSWEVVYNLDIWEEEGTLDQVVPKDVIFSYKGLLYTVNDDAVNDGNEYIPKYHGLPGDPKARWALVAIELEWIPNVNYRVNSIVTRNGKWYIANYQFNAKNWFTNDPETHSGETWSEWREIEPLTEDNFKYFEGTNLKDYRMDPDKVKYK